MKLIHRKTRVEVQIGDKIAPNGGGDVYTVVGVEKPRSPASTGRVYVTRARLNKSTIQSLQAGVVDLSRINTDAYFPNVFDMEWIEREDREPCPDGDACPDADAHDKSVPLSELDKQLLGCLEFLVRMQSSNPPSGFDRITRIEGVRKVLAERHPELLHDGYFGKFFAGTIIA